MPRITTTQLDAYAIQIQKTERQITDPRDGQPIFAGDGTPKMSDLWIITLFDPQGHDTVVIPLTEEGRDQMVAGLMGGILPVSADKLPKAPDGNGGIETPPARRKR